MSVQIERLAATAKESEGIIGHLTWWSIREHLITRDVLGQKLNEAGLDEGWLPNEIRPADAFRRATKEVECRKKETSQPGVYKNYLVREVYSDKKMVQRNIVVETVDQKGKRLDYEGQAALLVLDKEADQLKVGVVLPEVEELAQEASRLYDIYKRHYPAQAVRVMVADILKSMSPTPVRPTGGVYFVPQAHQNELTKLCAFVNSLDKGEAFKIPLIDTMDNRQMVNRKLQDHLEDIMARCHVALKGDLKKNQVKEIIEEAKRVISDFRQYREIVTDDIDRLESHIQSIRMSVALMVESL
ncbi:hypothetical protein HUR95_15750 [Caldalkalibacillus thermarum TA2.A1]|uniref:Uncharacterized protein n=1 Tax=Caldalkalibacillus thermarum (strain TA2.A1) TaxID=986075 RepID=A0A8X8I3C7_CALTT|nr:DUF6744 family protein [Caldalkalibacillus thermarum]QZT33660.1 hypothetical protein HUR95_15750 [Caldalkalibacillus thermarum TA2.A1]